MVRATIEPIQALAILRVGAFAEFCLRWFFKELRNAGDGDCLAPYEFTDAEAIRRAQYEGKDDYYILYDGALAIGYGMLRGWDDGHDIPSLGIVIHPDDRGKGWGKLLMQFLHVQAKHRGATKVMLKMDPDNGVALKLYLSLGYVFENELENRLVGFVDLGE